MDAKENGFVIKDGVLKKYKGKDYEIVIPDGVTTIGKGAFRYLNIVKIFIPDSVKVIEAVAFECCSNMMSVDIPDGVVELGSGCFASCHNLKRALVPGSVKKIGKKAFGYCKGLEEVLIEEGVEELEKEVFFGCPKLKTVTFPSSLNKVGDYCFNLTQNVTVKCAMSEREEAFYKNWALESYNLKILWKQKIENSEKFKTRSIKTDSSGVVYDSDEFKIRNGVLVKYLQDGSNIIIPEGVKGIGVDAFFGKFNIKNVTIPNSVEKIGSNAFACCYKLEKINIPASVKVMENQIFDWDKNFEVNIEAESAPSGWDKNWLGGKKATVNWGVKNN